MRPNHIHPALLRTPLNRAELLAISERPEARRIRIAVHRNHSFELTASVLNAFLGASDLAASFHYSAYDDSLAFAELDTTAQLHLLWLDASRYAGGVFPVWLQERLDAITSQTHAPVVVVYASPVALLDASAVSASAVLVCHLDAELALAPEAIYSERLAALTGTRLAPEALLESARLLGLRLLPAVLKPALKGLVLDLDNTLYAGVLGEDGPERLRPFFTLQQRIKELAGQGFLLALASRNEERDVRELFARRSDFPLRWEDFHAHEIHWQPKAESIRRIAEQFNIGLDALLFIDDNPGEIFSVSRALPEINIIEAADEETTLKALTWQPGLFKTHVTAEDSIRGADIAANQRRKKLRAATPEEYLAELQVELDFYCNPWDQRARITELLNKTNQFILSFLRPTASEVEALLTAPDSCIVTVGMKDRLSDSGIIAIAIARRNEDHLQIRELVVSCRALGRGIEQEFIAKMLTVAQQALSTEKRATVVFTRGPRNGPGLAWLESVCSKEITGEQGTVEIASLPTPKLSLTNVRIWPASNNAPASAPHSGAHSE